MKILRLITKVGEYGAAINLIALMLLTTANIIGRSFFHFPIKATTIQISSYMLLMIMALGLGGAAMEGRHIKVDWIMDRLPKKAQLIIDTAISVLTFVMLGFTTWAMVRFALTPRYTCDYIYPPEAPFKWVLAVGWGLFCVGALAVMIENSRKIGFFKP